MGRRKKLDTKNQKNGQKNDKSSVTIISDESNEKLDDKIALSPTKKQHRISTAILKVPKKEPKDVINCGIIESESTLNNSSSNNKKLNHSNETQKSNQVNAFLFMMDNRHKSIGQNSEGNILEFEKSPVNNTEIKEEKIKKEKFKAWAESKVSTKRKLQVEEAEAREIFLNDVMEKRAKRLKRMLKIDLIHNESDNSDSERNAKQRKPVSYKEECDFDLERRVNKKTKTKKISMNNKKEDCYLVSSDNSSDANSNVKSLKSSKKHILSDKTNKNLTTCSKEEIAKTEEGIAKKKSVKLAPIFAKNKKDPAAAEARKSFLNSELPDCLKKKMLHNK